MDADEASEYADAVVAQVLPHVRAAVYTWASLGVEAPAPADLAQMIVDRLCNGQDDA
jgi:hypothetical protein